MEFGAVGILTKMPRTLRGLMIRWIDLDRERCHRQRTQYHQSPMTQEHSESRLHPAILESTRNGIRITIRDTMHWQRGRRPARCKRSVRSAAWSPMTTTRGRRWCRGCQSLLSRWRRHASAGTQYRVELYHSQPPGTGVSRRLARW